jgi:ABC-2 type transport system ATP-binding protein
MPFPSRPLLQVEDVTRRYGSLTAVSHVSFTARPGEIIGYLGPNGSGKSTTVKMLVGLMPPSAGRILFKGVDIQEQLVHYKARIGYVPEEAHVYTHLTGPEYLRMTGRLRGLPAARLERKIDDFLRLFGLDAEYHTPLSAYSKGMRQKILLSAALLHNPDVLVLDEPMSGLDVGTALMLRAAIGGLASDGRLVFYTSHELETVEKISSRVIILREGAVVADDSAARLRELMQAPSLEDVFSQLTVRQDLDAIGAALLETVRR